VAVLVGLVALAACGGGGAAGSKATGGSTSGAAGGSGSGGAVKVGLVFDVGGRGDGSFNDAAAAGLERAQRELGVEARAVTAAGGGENREDLLRLLASQRYGLVFGIGFAFAGPAASVARDFPGTDFGIVDTSVPAPNVASLVFSAEQGAFLAGAAAARKSHTGKLGFVGGVDTDNARQFEAGFVAGARRVNPRAAVDVRYLTQPPDLSGFADPARAREVARGMYQAGADVVFHVAGGSGVGVFEAARDTSAAGTKVWAIGVDSDQYKTAAPELRPFILTSVLKRIDVAVFDTIAAFQRHQFRAGLQRFDLASGGVDVTSTGGALDDIAGELSALREQIVRGEITVPTRP
jgi:basic membrane protein A